MNVLKHQDLVPAGRMVSYASFIAEESSPAGCPQVSRATVFVSHVWKMTTKDFFEVCLAEMGEEEYAWIDLYLHNQYQGAVSDIGDANSMYWIDKFGQLIRGIGKVIAIVTDWEKPMMLTRIWCLFELNAAIDSGAVLKFVSTAAERQDLSLNLADKFEYLEALVKRIDVRHCDATRPHEIQDKGIFLVKLHGMEDEVNEKLRTQMRKWLAGAAQDVIRRASPKRAPLTAAQQAAEVLITGGARKTRLLEACPRLPEAIGTLNDCVVLVFCVVALLMLAYISEVICVYSGPVDDPEFGVNWTYESTALGVLMESSPNLGRMLAALIICMALLAVGVIGEYLLRIHQVRRGLPIATAVCAGWAVRRVTSIGWVVFLLTAVSISGTLAMQLAGAANTRFGQSAEAVAVWVSFALLVLQLAGASMRIVQQRLQLAASSAFYRAKLAVFVGWLQLRDSEGSNAATEHAEQTFRRAHNDLQEINGERGAFDKILRNATGLTSSELSNFAAPGLARSLSDLGRVREAWELRKQVDAQVESGSIFRARMAAAVCAPPAEIMMLLTNAGETAEGTRHVLGPMYPEMAEFLERMTSGELPELQVLWDKLPPMMRAKGDDPISPWIKIKCKDRALYKRQGENVTSLALPTDISGMPAGVRYEVEIGMQGLSYSEEEWEIAYAELGGEGCHTVDELMAHRNVLASRMRNAKLKKCGKFGFAASIAAVLLFGVWVIFERVLVAAFEEY